MIMRRGNGQQATVFSEVQITLKRFFVVLWLGVVASCLLPRASMAAFEDTGTGARPTVMGGTYVAAGGDVQSLMYNPAGLAQLHTHELTSEYSKLYAGLSDGSNLGQYFMGYGQPIAYGGTIAVGWKQFSLDNLYTERTLSLGYGEWITPRIAAGLAFKQLHHEFTAPTISVDDNGNITNQSPTFFQQYGNASTAYSTDLGLLYRYTDRDIIGFSVQDVNEPNVALNPADHEIVPRTLRAGISHSARHDLTLAGSVTEREGLSNQDDYTWTGAVEKWWSMKDQGDIAARGSVATGSRSFQQMAMGASYRYSAYQIDYAFVFNMSGVTLGNTAGTHRFSFTYRFGPTSPEHVRIQDKSAQKTTEEKRPQTASKYTAPRATVEDIPELENQPKTAPKGLPPVAGQQVQRPTASKPEVEVPETPEAPASEVNETAQMMQKTPTVTTPKPEQGPGLQVQVPAPVPTTTAGEGAAVGATDVEVPVQPTQNAVVEPLTRVELLQATVRMVNTYVQRTNKRVSAESRLDAFSPLYPALKGYALNQSGEMLEQVDRGDALDRSARTYDTMKWNGASAQQRLAHLERDLSESLNTALRDRTWNTNDLRDRRYKAWLEQTLTKGRHLKADGVSVNARLTYWGAVAQKALDYENMPSELVPAPVPVVTPVQKPVQVKQPMTELESAPEETPVSAPKESTNKAKISSPESAIGRPLGDGEWLYRVQDGDTLLSLANQFYGDYNRWRDIYVLNQDRLGRGGSLRTGQLLVMPKKGAK